MLTLYNQEQATHMMLASERRAAEARGTVKGIILLLKTQGTSSDDAAKMLQKILSISKSEAEEAIRMYW